MIQRALLEKMQQKKVDYSPFFHFFFLLSIFAYVFERILTDLLKSSKTALPIKSQFSKQMNRHDRNNKENKKNDATKKKSHPLVGQRQQHHKLNHNKRDLKGKELHDKKEKKKSSGKQLNETKNQDASVKNKVSACMRVLL